MCETTDTRAEPRRPWIRFLVRGTVAVVVAAVCFGGWMVYRGIAVSLQAEKNLHATLFTIRLVEQFVAQQGRWPRAWGELEGLSVSDDAPSPLQGEISAVRIGGQHGYDWPAASQEIQQCVTINFAADLAEIVRQDPMEFTAIKPIGPYYEYRDYGFVASLQTTIRGSVKGLDDP